MSCGVNPQEGVNSAAEEMTMPNFNSSTLNMGTALEAGLRGAHQVTKKVEGRREEGNSSEGGEQQEEEEEEVDEQKEEKEQAILEVDSSSQGEFFLANCK